ncbi:hypothetical protein [Pseudomonas veronii]|nr:hypothetical protein [Pseudomonas veronii]
MRLRQPNFAGLMLIVSAKGSGQATGTEYLIGVCLAMASAFFYAVAAAITKRLKDLPWAPMGITSKVLIGAVATWCAGHDDQPSAARWNPPCFNPLLDDGALRVLHHLPAWTGGSRGRSDSGAIFS